MKKKKNNILCYIIMVSKLFTKIAETYVKPFKHIGNTLSQIFKRFVGRGKKNAKIIAVHFPINSVYNTSVKRLKFVRKLGVEPIKRQHKTPTYYKYRIKVSNPKKKHYTKKINGVNVIFEA